MFYIILFSNIVCSTEIVTLSLYNGVVVWCNVVSNTTSDIITSPITQIHLMISSLIFITLHFHCNSLLALQKPNNIIES